MRHTKVTLTIVLASAIYLLLAISAVNYVFGALPRFDWAQDALGRLAGVRLWSHAAHAAGLLIAAIPPALLLGIVGRSHAVRWAGITGVLTSAAALVPSFLHAGVRPYLDASFY